MGSTQEFVDFVVDQFDADCGVTARKMFGEYGLYSGGKMFAMVCDDRLLFKRTEGGEAHFRRSGVEIAEAAPYPGARPILLIDDRLDDGPWLSELARITRDQLPEPRPRKKSRKT